MTTPGKIVRHRNGTNGKSNEHYHQILCAEMIVADTMKPRCKKDMRNKISDNEDEFKSKHAWAASNDEGVIEQHGEATFNDTVTKKINAT